MESLLTDCRNLLKAILNKQIVHAYQEANQYANALAKLGATSLPSFIVFLSPLPVVESILAHDKTDMYCYRIVNSQFNAFFHGLPTKKMLGLQPIMLTRCKKGSYCNIQMKPKDPIQSKVKILVKNTNKEIQTDLEPVQCAITQIHLPNNLVKTTLVCNFHIYIYIYIYINERYSTSKAISIYYMGSVCIDCFKKCILKNSILKT